MKIKQLTRFLEELAPPVLQESYDNAGLIVGDPETEITGVLVCLDSTEAVVEEATELGCNLIVAHHPIVFRGLKKLNGRNYVERTIISAIKKDIAIYAIHTNLDNVYHQGVNSMIARRLMLENTRILVPKNKLSKLSVLVPAIHSDPLRKALFQSGAGEALSGQHSSFATIGAGTLEDQTEASVRLDLLFRSEQERAILTALHENHPAEQPVFDIQPTGVDSPHTGAGLIGDVADPVHEHPYLEYLKDRMKAGVVRHTRLTGRKVRSVAVCGGSGSFLLPAAIARGAEIFVTADFKYHEFFDADDRIVIADIGHYESEQFTIRGLQHIISDNFSNFAAHCTKVNTNPVRYL